MKRRRSGSSDSPQKTQKKKKVYVSSSEDEEIDGEKQREHTPGSSIGTSKVRSDSPLSSSDMSTDYDTHRHPVLLPPLSPGSDSVSRAGSSWSGSNMFPFESTSFPSRTNKLRPRNRSVPSSIDSSELSYRSQTPSWIRSSDSGRSSDSDFSFSTLTPSPPLYQSDVSNAYELREPTPSTSKGSLILRSDLQQSSSDVSTGYEQRAAIPKRKKIYFSSSSSSSEGKDRDRGTQRAAIPKRKKRYISSSSSSEGKDRDRGAQRAAISNLESATNRGSSATRIADVTSGVQKRTNTLPAPPPPPPQPPPPPPRIDNLDLDFLQNRMDESYQITRQLSSGAFGFVYEGQRMPENQVCAVKVLKTGLLYTSEDSLRREVNVVIQLIQNPNNFILRFYGVLENPVLGRVYIGSELSAAGDLYQFMQRRNAQNQSIWAQMQELPAMYLIRCIARGLQYLHNLGIAHGDLKPENILLFPSANPQQFTTNVEMGQLMPKICDFSNSKQHSNTDPLGEVLETERMCTINYSAPESDIRRIQPYDMIRADIYSLGCVLLAILLGGRPFVPPVVPRYPDPNQTRHEYQRLCTKLKSNRDYVTRIVRNYNCSEALKDLLLKTLTVSPNSRIPLLQFLLHHWFVSR